ncbi:MAG: acyltransferase [Candidatus Competibacteraceae bacterium]|nr:acyltransferase [Candidatus Competibacteraceae bacterium]MCB1814408.1 acyltransferase [Candidatus Competibacteraceae bacterium]
MLGVPPVTTAFPGIDAIGENCRISPTVTILREQRQMQDHGIFLGQNVSLYDHVRLVLGDPAQHPDTNLIFGNHVIVNSFCYLSGEGGLRIDDEVLIGSHVKILSAGHLIDGAQLSIWRNPLTYQSIDIGRGVWIAAGATVLQGVTIGEGAVIGAGSIVTRDIPKAAIAAGNPARVLRYRKGFEPIQERLKKKRFWATWLRR